MIIGVCYLDIMTRGLVFEMLVEYDMGANAAHLTDPQLTGKLDKGMEP